MKSLFFVSIIAVALLHMSCKPKLVNAANLKNATESESKTENVVKKENNPYYSRTDTTVLHVSDADWKKVLSPDLYAVSREKDTERPFTGKYWDYTGNGTYYCAACGNRLFRSDAKFSSSCGWPSFFEQERASSVVYHDDSSFGMTRVEALCGRCGGHLGHLFDDGPPPTGKRYCMNSICLDFVPDH
jgi:methionine-R-sulfoxide reductase